MRSEKEFQRLAEDLVKFGRKSGAEEIQVSIGMSENTDVEVREGDIERLQESATAGAAVKVIVDDKSATASSSDLRRETLEQIIKNAVKRAKYMNEDPYSRLPELTESAIDPEKLKIYDPKAGEIDPQEKIRRAKKLEEIAMKDERIKVSGGSFFSTGSGSKIIANSKGFSGFYRTSGLGMGVHLQAGDGDNLFEDGWYDHAVGPDGLDDIEAVANKAVQRVTRLIGGRKIDSQKVPVIIEAPVSGQIIGFLAHCLSGHAVYKNQSFLVDRMGDKIASDIVTVIDNPLEPGMPGSRPFDSEGVPGQETTLIDKGELKNYILDSYSARKLNMKSTGNSGGVTNFHLQPGDNSFDDLVKSIDKGFLLVQTIGQGTVPTTGDISKGAYGLWIENGELAYPVAEVTFSGNLEQILKDISMIADDLDPKRKVSGPSFKIAELTISGK